MGMASVTTRQAALAPSCISFNSGILLESSGVVSSVMHNSGDDSGRRWDFGKVLILGIGLILFIMNQYRGFNIPQFDLFCGELKNYAAGFDEDVEH
ncbi:MAG: hypothetical protein A3H43_01535 [Gammaproteobacteria bacterium RIFCSPLOWO2_02_FULL_42_9]|nr:MAG: hypothetical protein A3H43_01535 [Gammaproteobacteria bacterium RIFCSPLOWO2_02_FULL_42_9]